MRFSKIVRMFEDGNVCVSGLRGKGKDMLMANVAVRRKKPYVSNVNYGGTCYPFEPSRLDCGKNTYKDFLDGTVKYYEYPYPDGTDVYTSDLGVYFPSQYCNELNKDYRFIPVTVALSRQLANFNWHFNVQSLNRAWDKLREQSDQYINCRFCKVLFGKIVIQQVRIYELYDSAVRRVPPFRLPRPFLNADRVQAWRLERDRYEQTYGVVDERWLIYVNRSTYDTCVFRKMLREGVK